MEGTHHGPVTNKPTMFLEIGEFHSIMFNFPPFPASKIELIEAVGSLQKKFKA